MSGGRASCDPPTLADALADVQRSVGDRTEARRLAALALDKPDSWILAHTDAVLTTDQIGRLQAFASRRADGVPFAYLAGEREFYGRTFDIDPDVLIPRPETEHLVEWALSLELRADARVVDIGTGSGCVALTLAAERPRWRLAGTDISRAALSVAARNRARLGLDRVELVAGDLLDAVAGRRFDLIVSNPPYVAADDRHLNSGDVRFEPRIALTPGTDAIAVIGRLAEAAVRVLDPRGWLLLEHGYDQAEAVRQLLVRHGFVDVSSHKDLAGIERVSGGRLDG